MNEEQALIRALQNEETRLQAFEEVVRRHEARVKAWVRRWVSDPVLTDEVVQETFLAAWKGVSHFRGEAQLSSWLYKIAQRTAFRYLKAERLRTGLPWPVNEEGEPYEPTAESDVNYERLARELAIAKQSLTPIQQKVYEAVWEDGLAYKDIAATMGLSVNTIKAHVHHIRQRLWRFLRPWLGEE
jgi:RNA polymerase sigma-70 factor (ECF subfamily)